MKLFIISDIHGSFGAFKKAAEAFERENASLMVICGDYLNHGPRNPLPDGHDTKSLASALNSMKSKICGVRGNCDSEVDQMMLEFPVTEASCQLFLLNCRQNEQKDKTAKPSGRIFVHHGHLFDDERVFELTEEGSIIVSGHTHVPRLECRNSRFFVNPGSISLPKEDSRAGYATIETDEQSIKEICLKSLDGSVIKKLAF